jgi:hypothetical protein
MQRLMLMSGLLRTGDPNEPFVDNSTTRVFDSAYDGGASLLFLPSEEEAETEN